MKWYFLIGLISNWAGISVAAPCCGSVASVPSLMSADDRSQISTSFSVGSISGEATDEGKVRPRGNELDQTQRLGISGAFLVSDRFQTGFAVPVVRRVRSRGAAEASAWGLGDISGTVAYESLPEYVYSWWRPKGFLYLSVNAPTGVSEYETGEILRVDVRGRGFWSLGMGTQLSKTYGPMDLQLLGELRRSFPRTVRPVAVSEDYRLSPGWGTTLEAGIGYRPFRNLRVGVALNHNFEDSVRASGVVESVYAPHTFWTSSFSASYQFQKDMLASLAYQDQTLFGGARNVALSRVTLFTLQKNWER